MTLLIAHSLPTNPHVQTAFRNSFIHRRLPNSVVAAGGDVLFIHRQRLSDAGDFILLIIHTLAHIQTSAESKEWDDRNKLFVSQFFKSLKAVCADLFHSHTAAGSATPNGASVIRLLQATSASVVSPTELASVQATASSEPAAAAESKSDSKEDEKSLGLSVAAGAAAWQSLYRAPRAGLIGSTDSYSVPALMKRLQSYTAFQTSTALRSHLLTLEEDVMLSDELRASLGVAVVGPLRVGATALAPPSRDRDMSFQSVVPAPPGPAAAVSAGTEIALSDIEMVEELTDSASAELMRTCEALAQAHTQLTAAAASGKPESQLRELRVRITDLSAAQETTNARLLALNKMAAAAAAASASQTTAPPASPLAAAAASAAADTKSNS